MSFDQKKIFNQIKNRLRERVAEYTGDFSQKLIIASFSKSGTTLTLNTTGNHGLSTGNYIDAANFKNGITISGAVIDGNVVEFTTTSDHNQVYFPKNPYNNGSQCDLSGFTPSGYNSKFPVVDAATSRKFKINFGSTPPAVTSNGFLLEEDIDGFNGTKQITKISDTSFSYQVPATLATPRGTPNISKGNNIAVAATIDRAEEYYDKMRDPNDATKATNTPLPNWIFIVPGGSTSYDGDGVVSSDPQAANKGKNQYLSQRLNQFSVYIFIPTRDDILGGKAVDLAEHYSQLAIVALSEFTPSSPYVEETTHPIYYINDEPDSYDSAYYVHRVNFGFISYIQDPDMDSRAKFSRLREINFDMLNDMTGKVKFQ